MDSSMHWSLALHKPHEGCSMMLNLAGHITGTSCWGSKVNSTWQLPCERKQQSLGCTVQLQPCTTT